MPFIDLFSGTGDNDWDFREYDEYGNKNNQSIFDRRIDGDFTVWQTGSRLTEEGIRYNNQILLFHFIQKCMRM